MNVRSLCYLCCTLGCAATVAACTGFQLGKAKDVPASTDAVGR